MPVPETTREAFTVTSSLRAGDAPGSALHARTSAATPIVRKYRTTVRIPRPPKAPFGALLSDANIHFVDLGAFDHSDRPLTGRYLQAGAGIVADSDPETEYRETLSKAEGMVQAVRLAERGFEL